MKIITFLLVLLFSITKSNQYNLCGTQELIKNNVTKYKYSNENFSQNCNCSNLKTCVRKCCAVGFHATRKRCVLNTNTNYTSTIDVYDSEQHERVDIVSFKENLLIGKPKCEFFYPLIPKLFPIKELFLLQEDGRLWTKSFESFDNDHYCIDDLEGLGLMAFVCYEDTPAADTTKINTIGMIISMPFLLATFIAYALLPERNLHMKALMSYVINLMFGYLLLVIIMLSESEIPYNSVDCAVVGYFCLFFFLASFFWMNVICIDIWFAFSGFRGFSTSKAAERKRYLMYCGYAWGLSVLHILIVFVIDLTSSPDSWFAPNIGREQCFLKAGYAKLLYLYGPLGILTLINVILFAITAIKIKSIKKETAVLKREDSTRHNYEKDKQKFNLYVKLLFAMGVNWSFELIGYVVDWNIKNVPAPVWYLTDLCNAAYGVFIFFIFVYKRSIWRLLKKRYYTFIGRPYLANSMIQNPVTTKSTTLQTSLKENRPADNVITDKRSPV